MKHTPNKTLAVMTMIALGVNCLPPADAAEPKNKQPEASLRDTVRKLDQALDAQRKVNAAQAEHIETLQGMVKNLAAMLEKHIRQAQAAPGAGMDQKQVQAAIDAALDDLRARLPANDRPVPRHIFAKLLKIAPGATVDDVDEDVDEGVKIYQVQFQQANGKDGDAEFNEMGVLLKLELDIDVDNPPAVLIAALAKAAPGQPIRRARQELNDGKITFRVETRSGKSRARMELTEKGEIIELDATLAPDALPEKLAASLQRQFPGAVVRKVRHRIRDGDDYFEVEVRGNDIGKRKLKLNPDGTPFGKKDEDREGEAKKPTPPPVAAEDNDVF